MEQYRDEYYYNFSWFYDIEKQDSITASPVLVEVQQVEQTDDDNAYVELNAQYERERKRVAQICQKHAHELAEKDRAIAAQITEIEKLQNQLQIQQEFISLAIHVKQYAKINNRKERRKCPNMCITSLVQTI